MFGCFSALVFTGLFYFLTVFLSGDGFCHSRLTDRWTKRCLRTHKVPWSIWSGLLCYLGVEKETDGVGTFSYVPHQPLFHLQGQIFCYKLWDISFCIPVSDPHPPSWASLIVSITLLRHVPLHWFCQLTVTPTLSITSLLFAQRSHHFFCINHSLPLSPAVCYLSQSRHPPM